MLFQITQPQVTSTAWTPELNITSKETGHLIDPDAYSTKPKSTPTLWTFQTFG